MAAARDSLLSDRPPRWFAWCASLVIHLGLLLLTLYWLRPPLVRGAAKQPTREVGIVLKQLTDAGPLFEGEDDQAANDQPSKQSSNVQEGDPLLAALPGTAEIPSTHAALPRLPTLGALSSQPAASAGQMARGGMPSKNIGSKATTSLFGISGTGTRFVYLFDRSISMAGPPLRAAQAQLITSLEPLQSVHQFQIIFFNHEPQAWDLTGGQARIPFATDANKRMAEKFIQSVIATGGTFRHTALQLAIRLSPDVIFFLTDTDDPMSTRDLTAAISRAQRHTIAINTIEYGNGDASKNDNFLVQLARQTGGRYVYVNTQQLGR